MDFLEAPRWQALRRMAVDLKPLLMVSAIVGSVAIPIDCFYKLISAISGGHRWIIAKHIATASAHRGRDGHWHNLFLRSHI